MSRLDMYLSRLCWEFGMELLVPDNQLLALYGDGIFRQLTITVARYFDEFFWSVCHQRKDGIGMIEY